MKPAPRGRAAPASDTSLRLRITPSSRLVVEPSEPADDVTAAVLPQKVATAITDAMASGQAAGLIALAGLSESVPLSPAFAFFRSHARSLITALGHLAEDDRAAFLKARTPAALERFLPAADGEALATSLAAAPPMPGLEYLSASLLRDTWREMAASIQERARAAKGGLGEVLAALDPQLHLLGRVTFHLAENRRNEERPFAFLATYAHRPAGSAAVQHLPLAKAIEESADRRDQAKLVELLTPVRAAADRSSLIREWLDSRAIFTAQALTIAEAHRFLSDVPAMEESGLAVRVPDWWRARRRPRPTVEVRIGDRKPAEVGVESLLDFSVGLALDGDPLSAAEAEALLAGNEGLTLLRGRWVEVDRKRLQQMLDQWTQLRREHADGIDFVRGMRLLAGAEIGSGAASFDDAGQEWSSMAAGDWLRESLAELRDPAGSGCTPGTDLAATLRPYQEQGVRWLWLLTRLRMGGCLADDMGLGKTIQVIDLLLRLRADDAAAAPARPKRGTTKASLKPATPTTSLLVVPASLLGNWKQELARFAPQLQCLFVHRSECSPEQLDRLAAAPEEELKGHDLVITTYALAKKLTWLPKVAWRLVILDEAQAIKNASSAQTKAIKKLPAQARIALTGTPVENHLGDLWSLFDFCCPGLLGSAGEFKQFVRNLGKQPESHGFAALRRLVQPYILRRLKTDPAIAPDLPAKTVMRTECGLSRKQAALYERTVNDLRDALKRNQSEGRGNDIQRRGMVLATTMRLKQICNHPEQGLPSGAAYAAKESGKFLRLAEICEPIAARQEKVLVFTQFQAMCEPLAGWLAEVFGKPGVVLHGKVPVARRKELVQRFQEDDDVPFFVISVKSGGTGLNLTAASHVVHFDRWWNPAVENQATDRAFRIGQQRNVLVHAFVCRGTVEERIDDMLRQKQQLADQILGPTAAGETLLTEMSDEQLLTVLALDVSRAAEEST